MHHGEISVFLLGLSRLQETTSVKVAGPTQMPHAEIPLARPLDFSQALGFLLNKEDSNDNSVSEARLCTCLGLPVWSSCVSFILQVFAGSPKKLFSDCRTAPGWREWPWLCAGSLSLAFPGKHTE